MKCPACGSTKITEDRLTGAIRCGCCGYINKPNNKYRKVLRSKTGSVRENEVMEK
jgi:transcription initiation factor TFIIIB Brf1 subunit/transcription initiation factor TFIIB